MKVLKYKLCDVPPSPKDGPQPHEFMLPIRAEFLHLDWQAEKTTEGGFESRSDGAVFMWFLVDEAAEDEPRKFWVIPTGAEFERTIQGDVTTVMMPIASAVHPSIGCVVHLFEER